MLATRISGKLNGYQPVEQAASRKGFSTYESTYCEVYKILYTSENGFCLLRKQWAILEELKCERHNSINISKGHIDSKAS